MPRLVVLGWSGASTPELFDAIVAWPGGIDRRPELRVVLVGRSVDKLELVTGACRSRLAEGRATADGGLSVEVSTSTHRRAALEDADIVLNQVRVGGLAARAFDESFPWSYGLPGEETMGPGGFANALRTLPTLRYAWRDVAEVAPDALVINLTNPAGMVLQAAHREFGLQIVSVCDSPVTHTGAIAARLDRPTAHVVARYVGMNHVGWYVPETFDELDRLTDLAVGLDAEAVAVHEALGAPYVRYYVCPDRILAVQRSAETRAQALMRIEAEMLTGFASGDPHTRRRGAAWYGLAVVPFLDAWLNGRDEPLIIGTINGGRVQGVPTEAMVEVPVRLPGPGQLASPGLAGCEGPVALPPLPARSIT